MRHESLPQTKTPEELAFWITQHSLEQREHEEHIDLTAEERNEHEHQVWAATSAILELKEIEKTFKLKLKKGTQSNSSGALMPEQITIPPTKGLDALEANVKFHDEILKRGYNIEYTTLHSIPYPETKSIVYVDIEGNENVTYRKKMTLEQVKHYGTIFDKETSSLDFPQ